MFIPKDYSLICRLNIMILCVISMFIYVCECIGLRNIVIMMYMYLTMLYPINDLNLNLNNVLKLFFLYALNFFIKMLKIHDSSEDTRCRLKIKTMKQA